MATKGPVPEIVDPMTDPRPGEYAVIAPGHTFKSVTQKIAGIVLTSNTPVAWMGGLFLAATVAMGVVIAVTWLVLKGVGIWGITIPGAWGFAIINFVWWIGIGHAGTLISAILLLLRQQWRTSINRFAEAMTLFAVSCAGLLAPPIAGHDEDGAEFPQPTGVGCLRGFDLCHGLAALLVHRPDSGPCH